MITNQPKPTREGPKVVGKVAKRSLLAALLVVGGLMSSYSSLKPYQQERVNGAVLLHIAAIAPAGTFEPYQEERIRRALESDS